MSFLNYQYLLSSTTSSHFRDPLTFQNNLAKWLGLTHMPVQKEIFDCDIMMKTNKHAVQTVLYFSAAVI